MAIGEQLGSLLIGVCREAWRQFVVDNARSHEKQQRAGSRTTHLRWNDLSCLARLVRGFRFVASPAAGDRLLLCELGGPSRSLSTGRRVNTRHSLGLECDAINRG
jgi:hypothetical protein